MSKLPAPALTLNGHRLLSERQWHTLHTRQVLIDGNEIADGNDDGNISGYALGWEKRIYHGHDVSMHSGGQVGFASTMWLAPAQKFAVVVMQNLDFQAAPADDVVAWQILDHYFGAPPINHNERAEHDWPMPSRRSSAPSRNTVRVSPAVLIGRYTNDIAGTAELRSRENLGTGQSAPVMEFSPNSRARLRSPDGGDYVTTFEGTETNPILLRVRFSVDSDGRVVGFEVREEGDNAPIHIFSRDWADSH